MSQHHRQFKDACRVRLSYQTQHDRALATRNFRDEWNRFKFRTRPTLVEPCPPSTRVRVPVDRRTLVWWNRSNFKALI